ncbi:DNA polymerase III subunit gamma/tau [Marinifilum sp. D737]|jgi:DNA polymerase-3 subunit gamma/tau|uniref:DNA polymerase III subunit gamma/tau n=1 Tax=Marinifilum sp. D737 TaxID=2969628 RepID=UPI0022736C47|nr:DNA polymerase III subunit gamma/tau [Marinifilum sp. D737]MCY1634153.1 DNA polymerase III subunit gamma/tau [Marinifilum sp. D737]
MENFIVSARKYRPSTFSTVVGQESITVTLKNAIKNSHLAHAYLFCGPRGVGKTSCARIFAKTINCSNITSDFEACNECESCKAFNENRSYNIHELDAASNNSVDDIRTLIDQVRIPPQIGSYSIYIIDEVHMLSASAFNAFLKTLEEPPAHAIFVLATTEKHKILPTILSRCQIFDFNRIKVEDAVKHLKNIAGKESVNIDEEALNVIGQKADGAMRDALSIFDQIVSFSGKEITFENVIQNLNVLDYDYYFRIVDAALEGKVTNVLVMLNEIFEKGFDGHHFIGGLSAHIRDVLVGKDAATIQLLEVSESVKQKYVDQAKKCPVDFLYEALAILNQCDVSYKSSQNPRLLIELSLIQLSQIIESKKKGASLKKNSKKLLRIAIDGRTLAPAQNVPKSVGKVSTTIQNNGNPSKAEYKASIDTGVARNTYTSTVSIKQALKSGIQRPQIVSKPNSENKTEVSDITGAYLNAEYNKAGVFMQLKEFAKIKNKSERVRLALTVNQPELTDNKIVLKVSNPLQEDDINSVLMELQNYFRRIYNNNSISVETVKSATTKTKRVFTDTDRFNYLCKKNPALAVLKQKFSLDFE